jgi:eukaryotic-like serine/threonine-protein kinase
MTKAAQPTRKDSADPRAEGKSPNVVPIRPDDIDPLANFGVEGAAVVAAPSPPRPVLSKTLMTGIVAGVVVSGAAVAGIVYARQRTNQPSVTTAVVLEHAILNSRPDGAAVVVDGVARGVTPVDVMLAVGAHDVLFRNDAGERRLTVNVEKGTRVSENVDMPSVVASGQLDVTSDPIGARVTVDGTAAGKTPVKVRSLTVGRHVVVVSEGTTSVNRSVDVTAGATMSMFISLASSPSGSTGTVAIESPVELRLLEDGRLLGLSNGAPLVLPPGKHRLDLVNDGLEMRLSRIVTVDANKTTRVPVTAPNGTLFINASPWADVSIDGRSIGVTPLGDVSMAVGSHEVVWRHPQLGERRRTVVVGAQTPVRLTADMSSR